MRASSRAVAKTSTLVMSRTVRDWGALFGYLGRGMDRFIARENVRHLRRELQNGAEPNTRATMLRLLVEEENHLGFTYEELGKLDRHISRLSEIMARHVELTDNLRTNGKPTERAEIILATYNDLMAYYLTHRERMRELLSGS
jgi:hypothetical protein